MIHSPTGASRQDCRRSAHPHATQITDSQRNQEALRWRSVLLLFLLIAATLLLTLALRAPPRWKLDVGTDGDDRFVYGFSVAEVERGGTTTFRWSGPDARLVLHGANSRAFVLRLRLYDEQPAPTNDRRLALQRNGQDVAAWQMHNGWRVYHVLLDTDAVGQGLEATPLHLVSPIQRPGAEDGRRLGVVLDWLEIVPLDRHQVGQSSVVPLQRALLLTWALALLAGICWQLDRNWLLHWPRLPRLTVTRICVLVGLLAVALLWWALRNPYTLAWALPATPWLLGLATLLLAGMPAIVTTQRWLLAAQQHGEMPALPTSASLAAMGLLVLAQVLFHRQQAVGLGVALTVAGGVLLLAVARMWHLADIWGDAPDGTLADLVPSRRQALLWLLLIFAVALGMRLYRITELPFALWRDEARHGMIALRLLEDPDYRPIYIASGRVNMPALGFYPFALALRIWGIQAWSMRVVTALAGALTVLPLYALTWHLRGRRDVALLAATLLAVSSWHVTLSRFSFPTIFDPLLAVLGLWLLLVALAPGHRARFLHLLIGLVAGLCLGLAVQTYHTGRMVPVIAAVLALLRLWQQPRLWRRWVVTMLAVGLGLVLTLLPLLIYAVQHPEAFNERVGNVFLLRDAALQARAPLTALDESLGRHMLMFNVQGDSNGRHHAPDRPLLDFVTGLGFLVGCAFLLYNWRDWRSMFLLAGLSIALVPSALAVNGPHAMRSIGGTVFTSLIAALGWLALIRMVGRARQPFLATDSASVSTGEDWQRLGIIAGALIAVAALALNFWMYFGYMAQHSGVWGSSYPVQTQVGIYLRNLAETQGSDSVARIYVPEGFTSNAVFSYMTDGLPIQTFTDASLAQVAQPGTLFVLSGYTHTEDAQRLLPTLKPTPRLFLRGPDFPGTHHPSFVVYAVPER